MQLSKENIIIFFSLIISILLSVYFVNKFDAYHLDGRTHVMLKEETYAHWRQGALIIEQLKNKVNFFITGNEVFTKPLPQRIVALYSVILNFEIMDIETQSINLGYKLPFLILQSLIYYLSVLFFYKHLSSYFNERIKIIVLLFLCLEPTINQYHSSFWTESYYFSIQLIIFGLTLKSSKTNIDFLMLGFLLGVLFLQRTIGLFYIFIIIFYFIFFTNEKKFKIFFLTLAPYILIIFLLGMHNYLRADRFYFIPTESSYSQYRYFTRSILVSKLNKSINEINKSEIKKAKDWIDTELPEAKKFDLELNKSLLELARSIDDENLRISFYGFISKRNKEILLEYPLETIKKAIKGAVHFSVLNPFFIYYDYEYFKNYGSNIIGDFYFSEKHKELIPYRIFYSGIIYFVVIFGILKLLRQNFKLSILCIISVLYYYVLLGWYGKTRLFVPTLIYFSIFFGVGLDFLISKIKKITY